MPHDAFISHSSANREITKEICRELEKNNIQVWIAPRDVRSEIGWAQSIIEAIKSARVFVLVMSLDSNASKDVGREVTNAAANDITIVPFEIELVNKKQELDPTLAFYIAELHWVDGITPPFEERMQELVRRINDCLNQTAASSRKNSEKDQSGEPLLGQNSKVRSPAEKNITGGPEIPRELRVKVLKLMGYAFKGLYRRQMNYSGLYRNPCDAIIDRFEYQTGRFVGGAGCAFKLQNLVCWSETNDLLMVTQLFLEELLRYPNIHIVLESDFVAETTRIFKEQKVRYGFIPAGTGKVVLIDESKFVSE